MNVTATTNTKKKTCLVSLTVAYPRRLPTMSVFQQQQLGG